MKKVTTGIKKYKGELLYTLSNYTTPIITMVTNIISAAFLNPNELGVISSVMILLPYIAFLHFGVFNGLNRNLAFYRAQGKHDKVQQMVNASHTVAILNSVIGAVIGICYIVYYAFFDASRIYFLSAVLLLLNLILNPLIVHFDTTYRSGQNFKVLGKITLWENIVYGITNLLPIWIGYIGKIIANGLRVCLRFTFRFATQPYKANATGKKEDMVELAKVGFPLLIGSYLWGVIMVSDQTLIVTHLGTESLGFYSLSIFMMSAMVIIPTSINTLLYPKAAAQYGKSGNNIGLRKFFWRALSINILVLVPLCAALYFLLEPLTEFFLPKYLSGVPAAKINILTCLTFVSNGPSIIIGVVKENVPLLIVYGLAILSIWVLGSLLPVKSYSIEKIAWLRFFISAFISVFTLFYAYYLTGKNKVAE